MCAQYDIYASPKKIIAFFDISPTKEFEMKWKERILPYTFGPVIVQGKKGIQLIPMQFSLVPSWSKEKKVKFATHNARLYSFDEKTKKEIPIYAKPTWRAAFASRRCLIPMNAFIEPIYRGKLAGNMVSFHPKEQESLFAAGIWEEWISKETGEVLESFSILTDEPISFVKKIGHERSPVFLPSTGVEEWLDPSKKDPKELLKFLEATKTEPNLKAEIDRPLAKGWEKRVPS